MEIQVSFDPTGHARRALQQAIVIASTSGASTMGPNGFELTESGKLTVAAHDMGLLLLTLLEGVGPLSRYEQQFLMQTPEAICLLIDHADMSQDQADSMGAGTTGDQERAKELRALASKIIEAEPDLWDDKLRRRFGFPAYKPPGSPPSPCIYLAGPIYGRADAECQDWREMVKAQWKGSTLDPMRRDYRGREDEPGIAGRIVQGDLWDIRAADALLAYVDAPSAGTSMEIYHCYQEQKPVVVVNATGKSLSPWITFHARSVHASIPEALAALEKLIAVA